MAGTYVPRPKPKKRELTKAVATDIYDPDDPTIDPAMKATLGQESARRVGAAGVQLRTRNPFKEFTEAIGRLFRRGR